MPISSTPEPSKTLPRLFAFLIVVGMILTVFGFLGPIITFEGVSWDGGPSLSDLAKINSAYKETTNGAVSIKGFAPLNFFARATFILGIVTIVWFLLLCILYIENPELVYLILGGLIFLAAILAFIFALVLKKNYMSNFEGYLTEEQMQAQSNLKMAYGPIFLLIGGVMLGAGTAGLGIPRK